MNIKKSQVIVREVESAKASINKDLQIQEEKDIEELILEEYDEEDNENEDEDEDNEDDKNKESKLVKKKKKSKKSR